MKFIIIVLFYKFFLNLSLFGIASSLKITSNEEYSIKSPNYSLFDEPNFNLEPSLSLSEKTEGTEEIHLPKKMESIPNSVREFSFNEDFSPSTPISSFEMEKNFHENFGMFSNLLISPIMDKNKSLVTELSFEYSTEVVRSPSISTPFNQARNLIGKLFGHNGTKMNASGILRYGFLVALFDELNTKISKGLDSIKYVLSSKLIEDSLLETDCIYLLNNANKHFDKKLFSNINTGIFRIVCHEAMNKNHIFEMHFWKDEISSIIEKIKNFIISIKKNLDLQKENLKMIKLPEVPKLIVTGTEIKQRYLNIVLQMDTIKKKEKNLFNALIFTKKMAIKISTQYLPNGNELVEKCIKIITESNPALMRETYQKDKIIQICRTTMGN